MTKTKTPTQKTLDTIARATYDAAGALDAVQALVTKAGGMATTGVRDALVKGRIAATLAKSRIKCGDTVDARMAKAAEIMAAPAKKRGKVATQIEAAARQWVSRAFRQLGATQTSKKAANTNAKGANKRKEQKAEPAKKMPTPAIPSAANPHDFQKSVLLPLVALLRSAEQKSGKGVNTAQHNAIASFVKEVNAIKFEDE